MYMVNEPQFDNDAIVVDVNVAGQNIEMEVDTGARMSIIPEDMYRETFKHVPLSPSGYNLHVYNGDKLGILGQASVQVTYQDQCEELTLLVADIQGHPPHIRP